MHELSPLPRKAEESTDPCKSCSWCMIPFSHHSTDSLSSSHSLLLVLLRSLVLTPASLVTRLPHFSGSPPP